jgi:hypothetical protein
MAKCVLRHGKSCEGGKMYKFETVIIAKILSMYVPDSILEAEETDEELLYEMSRFVEAAKLCGAEKILIVM